MTIKHTFSHIFTICVRIQIPKVYIYIFIYITQANSANQLAIAERSNSESPSGIILGQDQLDQDLMEDPSAWSSIAEQYPALQDDLDMEVFILAIFSFS